MKIFRGFQNPKCKIAFQQEDSLKRRGGSSNFHNLIKVLVFKIAVPNLKESEIGESALGVFGKRDDGFSFDFAIGTQVQALDVFNVLGSLKEVKSLWGHIAPG